MAGEIKKETGVTGASVGLEKAAEAVGTAVEAAGSAIGAAGKAIGEAGAAGAAGGTAGADAEAAAEAGAAGIPTEEEMKNSLAERHGKEMQEKLGAASVAVCGLGGLGSNIAIALARAGVGRLHLIDFDTVDISNLNRQQYFAAQIGMKKTDALAETLRKIAPYCEIVTDTMKITDENISGLFDEDDIICEAFDSAEAKAVLAEGVLVSCPEKYLVSGSGMAGIGSANLIKTKKITDRFYISGDGESDVEEAGSLFASRVMVCAAHQAHAVIRIIAGYDEP